MLHWLLSREVLTKSFLVVIMCIVCYQSECMAAYSVQVLS